MKHAYLLHTGYGKTKLCLDKIINATHMPRTLLISTKNVIETAWPAEIKKWYDGKIKYEFITGSLNAKERMEVLTNPCDILGMNTEMLDWYISNTTSVKSKRMTKNDGIKYTYNTDELIARFNLIIIDEVSLFKNSKSERFKLLKKWCSSVKNVMVLSATPTPKNIEDIWAPIYLLDGGQRLGPNITQFRQDYGIAVPLPNGYNRYVYTQAATDEILSLIKDITTSVPAPTKPLFPEPILRKIMIKPDPDTADFLQTFKKDYIVQLPNKSELFAYTKNQLMNKVNQIASGSVYNEHQTIKLNNIKFMILQKRLSTITTPVLIPYVYVFDKDQLLTLPGARLLKTPQDFEDWNANKIPIGIISPFSAAHGLNLQDSECRDIIWFSPIWDTEKWIQTNARVCRRGQRYVVTISVLILKESYDDHAFDVCQDKFKVQYNNLQKLR